MPRKYTKHLNTQEWQKITQAVGRAYLQLMMPLDEFRQENFEIWHISWKLSQFPPQILIGFRRLPVRGPRAEEVTSRGDIQPRRLTDDELTVAATFVAELAESVGLTVRRLDKGRAALGGFQLLYAIRPKNYVAFFESLLD